MINIDIQLSEFTSLKKTLPYAYGTSLLEVLPRRAWCFFSGNIPHQKSINDRNTVWINMNKNEIFMAKNKGKMDTTIVHLPFQSISLNDSIKEGYISIINNKITINEHNNIKRCNLNYLRLDLLKELLLTTIVGSIKYLFDLINIQNIPYQCAIILGLAKGLTKSLADKLIYGKEIRGNNMLLKCTIDLLTEILTVLFFSYPDQKPNPTLKACIKGIFKYFLKHCFQSTLRLVTATEWFLETSKAGFRGFLRDYFYSIIGVFIGPMAGSFIGAIIINIFFDQCTYSPTQHGTL